MTRLLLPGGVAVCPDSPSWTRDAALALAKAHRGEGPGTLLGGGSPDGGLLFAPRSKPTPQRRPGASAKPIGHVSGVVDPSAFCSQPTGEPGSWGMYGYRTVFYCLPTSWVLRYLEDHAKTVEGAYGLVSSVDDCLDALWPYFPRDAGPDPATLHGLIDCWGIKTDEDWLFWKGGWGAPHRVFLNQLKLIAQHWSVIQDLGTGLCTRSSDGSTSAFALFVLGQLSGLAMAGERGRGESCFLRLNVVGAGTGFHRKNTTLRCFNWRNELKQAEEPCSVQWEAVYASHGREDLLDAGKDLGSTRRWNVWDPPKWQPQLRVWIPADRADDTPFPGWVFGKAFQRASHNLLFKPQNIAWMGFLADWLMFNARMAWDFYRDTELEEYQVHASRMARYALRVVTQGGLTTIHELGHIWTDGRHCEGSHHCCYERAAYRWLTFLKAHHGLPWEPFLPWNNDMSGDYPEQNPALPTAYSDDPACRSQRWSYNATLVPPATELGSAAFCSASLCGVATGCTPQLVLP